MKTEIAKGINENNYLSYESEKDLNKILLDIEDFYYSDFWIQRLRRRGKEEYIRIDLSKILDSILELNSIVRFKTFEDKETKNAYSTNCDVIAVNTNMSDRKINDSHIYNLIMHELGHRQYDQRSFKPIIFLNKISLGDIESNLIKEPSKYKYFTDHDELRQRIIPIVREMYINNWTPEEAYFQSPNLIQDDIYKLYGKEYIIHLLKNIL